MAYQVPNLQNKPSVLNSSPAVKAAQPAKSSWFKSLLTLIMVVIIVGGGVYLISDYAGLNLFETGAIKLDAQWQAVFLTNGQVYFGKVGKVTRDSVSLRDIYYLQVVSEPLQRSQEGEVPVVTDNQQAEQRLTLVKLGNEIHGPADAMLINRSQVVLIENLKDDAKVVQAINDYINTKK